MFETHQIHLSDTFDPDDVIFIRFWLVTDGAVIGWGWVIDNIQIQTPATIVVIPDEFQISQNYPNPDGLHI